MERLVESETVELKAKYTDSFAREVTAFLNTNGGVIYIGVNDDGRAVGVQNTDAVLKNISDCVSDQIEPSPQSEVSTELLFFENKAIIKVNIKRGIRALYCIKKYGFSLKGCPVRIGTTCKEMTPEEIQYRYRSNFTGADYMLLSPAKYSPLSFDMMKILLTSKGFHVNEESFESSFNLRRNDGSYNLLAELVADRNMIPLIFVKFQDKNKVSISYRSDYGNQSILLGYQKLKDRLIAENICKTDTTVRPRIDEYLYDADCVNEALVNMLVHNDWTVSDPLVSFYSDRVVFTSHGGLPDGMSVDDFFRGVSRPRNAVLMRIFLNLGIVEHTGHGVPVIVHKYGREAFDIQPNGIDVTIPFNPKAMASVPYNGTDNGTDYRAGDLSEPEKKVILEIIKDPHASYDVLSDETGMSRRTVSRIISALKEKGYIKRIGNNKNGFWTVIR